MSGDAPTAPLHHRPPPERGRSGRPTGALRPVFFRQTRSAGAALFSSRSDQLDPLALCTMSRAWAAAGHFLLAHVDSARIVVQPVADVTLEPIDVVDPDGRPAPPSIEIWEN